MLVKGSVLAAMGPESRSQFAAVEIRWIITMFVWRLAVLGRVQREFIFN